MIDLKRCILHGHLQNDPLHCQQKRAHHADQEYQVEFNHFACLSGRRAMLVSALVSICGLDDLL